MRRTFALLAVLALAAVPVWAATTGGTPCCHYPYSNSEPLNTALDKIDQAMCKAFFNCNANTPAFVTTVTTTTATTTTAVSTTTTTT